jgi:alcohol dehydrogenase, propanol-preferring
LRLSSEVSFEYLPILNRAYIYKGLIGLNVVGISVGVEEDMHDLLEMVVKGEVVPHVEVFNFEDINDIMGKLAKFEVQGKAVLRIPE